MLVGGIVAATTPPWQNPDELSHVMRVFQICYGELVAHRLAPLRAGGLTDNGVILSATSFGVLPFHKQAKVTAAMLRDAHAPLGLKGTEHFSNTAIYPPFLYAPSVLAGLVSLRAHLDAAATLLAMRLSALAASVAIAAAALAHATRIRVALAAVLALPMSLALAASPAQDGLLIALAAWVAAATDRAWEQGAVSRMTRLAVAAALLLMVLARPPYLPLLGVLLLLPGSGRVSALLAGAAAGLAVGWTLFAEVRISVAMPGVSAMAQVVWLLHHPLGWLRVLAATAHAEGWRYAAGLVGTFGWLDTPLPDRAVVAGLWALFVGLLGALAPARGGGPARQRARLAALLLALGTAAAVVLAMYVSWTPPGAPQVEGVQGRYFLPLLPFVALGLPSLGPAATWLRPVSLGAAALIALVGPAVTVTTLLDRYYLAP